ncbi:zinc dependent phospholipase C family protein [Anaerosacchariphilus polymeriproducens]|uniref:Phospholipase C n=1 Tax=Anaerosacchariphilus polymeriproducens TaxID=1812858 RepID=A0A371ARA9_9FIRM|nr:zinc dependent phospholipase C family protein [Anaerosacchariphilus polymeriproducens]RDU21970.1 phospholipase [Anaerosacchariphilus polymeriproducens]
MHKKLKQIFIGCLLIILMVSSNVYAGTEKTLKGELPSKVIDIMNGHNVIYGSGVPLAHNKGPVNKTKIRDNSGKIRLTFESGGVDHTHQYIVANAVGILLHDKGDSVLSNKKNVELLLTYTDWPDKFGNETDYGTFVGHFYDPNTGKNWLGRKSPTAKGRAVSYFNAAISEYKKGNIESAIINLGKGSHYIADLNEPHHASNLTALNSNHTKFEKYLDVNRALFKVPGNSLDKALYIEALNLNIDDFAHLAAVYSNGLVGKAQDKSTYYEAAEKSVQHAIINTVQYFYKFSVSVGELKF